MLGLDPSIQQLGASRFDDADSAVQLDPRIKSEDDE
jgi:hypothetical protein